MKNKKMKRICAIVAVSLLLSVCLSLSACGEKTTAEKLLDMWERDRAFAFYDVVSQHLRETENFAVTSDMAYETTLDGLPYRISNSSRTICLGQDLENMSYLSEHTLRSEQGYGASEYHEVVNATYTMGYTDGYLFRSYMRDGLTFAGQTIAGKTPYTMDEYRSLYNLPADDVLPSLGYWDCANATCRQLADGTWEARFSGLGADALQELHYVYGVELASVGHIIYLADAEVTVMSDADFAIDTIFLGLTYAEYGEDGSLLSTLPTIHYTLEFAYGDAVPAMELDLSDYGDIGDLSVVDKLFHGLNARQTAANGYYVYQMIRENTAGGVTNRIVCDQTFLLDSTGGSLVYENKGRYDDGNQGGSFSFDYAYRNGTMSWIETDSQTGQTATGEEPMTQAEVYASLAPELELPDLYSECVIRIEELSAEEGKYRIHLGGILERNYAELYESEGGELTAFEVYVDVTLRGIVLDEYAYHSFLDGYTADSPEYRIETTITSNFIATQ